MGTRTMMRAAGILGALCLVSCSVGGSGGGYEAYKTYDRPAKLPANPSAVTVKVSLGRQRAYVMEGGTMLMAMPVTVGAPDTPTPTGDFRILRKEAKRRDPRTRHPLPYWCELRPGLGFHTGWVRHSPATNDGCIRMHENLAPKFFRMVSVGTPVNIAWSQPEDAKWATMKLPPDAGPLPDYHSSVYAGGGYFTRHKEPEFE